ncbi:MAG: hypothetical protein MRY83_21600 [Flavobacteriales bacterium]|nr:hypothetical protein [Flavobacteriales bacterium]
MKDFLKILFCFFVFCGCKNETLRDSVDYSDLDQRNWTLSQEIKMFSGIQNSDFELFNVNGFKNSRDLSGVPGSSSFDYRFVVKVNPDEIDLWTKSMQKIETLQCKDEWINVLIKKQKNQWILNSTPEYYFRKGDGVCMAVYRKEGIIFKRVYNI